VIIGPAGRLGPIAAKLADGSKVFVDERAKQLAVGFAKYPEASFRGHDTAGH